MATYWVKTAADGGNDGNAGTEALPWLTPVYAFANSGDGDDIYVNAGDYEITGGASQGLFMNPATAVDWIAVGTVTFKAAAANTLRDLRLI